MFLCYCYVVQRLYRLKLRFDLEIYGYERVILVVFYEGLVDNAERAVTHLCEWLKGYQR
jgi:hypothetical protein